MCLDEYKSTVNDSPDSEQFAFLTLGALAGRI